jgi:hypothetical protein
VLEILLWPEVEFVRFREIRQRLGKTLGAVDEIVVQGRAFTL